MPGPLPRTKSNGWWNRRWPYRVFLLRELSSVAVAAYVALLLVLVSQVRDGEGRSPTTSTCCRARCCGSSTR